MTVLTVLIKGLLLVLLAFVAFAVLAISLGYEPPVVPYGAECLTDARPSCLFVIF